MKNDHNELLSQLSPGWSGVNIALMVVLFMMFWPLGLLMVGYIIWGRSLGLNLRQPETFARAGSKLSQAFRVGVHSLNNAGSSGSEVSDSEPSVTEASLRTEAEKLRIDRAALQRERAEFEAEKREFEQQREQA
jgi:hypothetical protein